MPPRSNPTARQERLGAELRKLREQAGLTARETARLLGTDQAKISHLEAGRVSVSEERVRRLASRCACDDPALVDALAAMATERVRGWWEEYQGRLSRGFLDLAEAEFHATAARIIKVTDIPGIMQTEAHARALFDYVVPKLTPDELEDRIAHRMRRSAVLDRRPPLKVEAVIHEAALRMAVGGAAAARQQLTHLLDMSERPNVEIRVIPFSPSGFAGSSWSMYYLAGPVPQLDTVHLDTPLAGVFLDAEAQLRRYRTLFMAARESALEPHPSRDLVRRVVKKL